MNSIIKPIDISESLEAFSTLLCFTDLVVVWKRIEIEVAKISVIFDGWDRSENYILPQQKSLLTH